MCINIFDQTIVEICKFRNFYIFIIFNITKALIADVAPQAEVPICVTCFIVASCSLHSITFSIGGNPSNRSLHNSFSYSNLKRLKFNKT